MERGTCGHRGVGQVLAMEQKRSLRDIFLRQSGKPEYAVATRWNAATIVNSRVPS